MAGFSIPLAIDIDPIAVQTYNWNRRSNVARAADLAAVRASSIVQWWRQACPASGPRGVIGGPPCQAFSVSNVHRLAQDPRAQLPLAYAKILKKLNDSWALDFFVFENVGGLGTKAHAQSLELFKERFADAGFESVQEFYLDAVDFGVAQRRRRMFIAGLRKGADLQSVQLEPSTAPHRTVRDAIGQLVAPMFYSRKRRPSEQGLHPNHWCMNPRSSRFNSGILGDGKAGRSFRVLKWDEPSATVAYGHREVHIHPDMARRLSVYEAMRLQGFPEWYELRGNLSDQIRQVSDAVPPPLATALAAAIPTRPRGQVVRNGQEMQKGARGLQTSAPRSTRP